MGLGELLGDVVGGIGGLLGFGSDSVDSQLDDLLGNNDLFGFGDTPTKDSFWLDITKAAIPAVAQLGGGLFQSEIEKDKAQAILDREDKKYQQELELARQKMALELKLAALKAQYAGGGGASTKLTDAQRLAQMQSQSVLKQDAITSALNALQNAYGLGQR